MARPDQTPRSRSCLTGCFPSAPPVQIRPSLAVARITTDPDDEARFVVDYASEPSFPNVSSLKMTPPTRRCNPSARVRPGLGFHSSLNFRTRGSTTGSCLPVRGSAFQGNRPPRCDPFAGAPLLWLISSVYRAADEPSVNYSQWGNSSCRLRGRQADVWCGLT